MTKHQGVFYRIAGGRKAHRRNVETTKEGTVTQCADEIRAILAATHDVLASQIQLLSAPPPPEPTKPRAGEIRKKTKAELVYLVEQTPALSVIDTDATKKEIEDAIIERLELED